MEHAADPMPKYILGEGCRTPYERWRCNKCHRAPQNSARKLNLKGKATGKMLEATCQAGYFLGKYWRTGEAIASTGGVVRRAATVRRVGAHRRWGTEGLTETKGPLWNETQRRTCS